MNAARIDKDAIPIPKFVDCRATAVRVSCVEVVRLIDAARPPLHRTPLMALYATGLRRAELTRLKVSDVDRKRMVIVSA